MQESHLFASVVQSNPLIRRALFRNPVLKQKSKSVFHCYNARKHAQMEKEMTQTSFLWIWQVGVYPHEQKGKESYLDLESTCWEWLTPLHWYQTCKQNQLLTHFLCIQLPTFVDSCCWCLSNISNYPGLNTPGAFLAVTNAVVCVATQGVALEKADAGFDVWSNPALQHNRLHWWKQRTWCKQTLHVRTDCNPPEHVPLS